MDFAGIDTLSLVDYDGEISTTIFTKGCNFRCPFCHNKTLVSELDNEFISWETLYSYLKKRAGVLDAVVITGGEPTLMNDLVTKIKSIKELGYKIKLDTNGTSPEVLKELVNSKLIDYVAMDVKNGEHYYDKTCGTKVDISKIKESLDFLKEGYIDYELRTTLVDEYHSKESILDMINLVKGHKKLYLQKFIDRENCITRGLHEVNKEKAEEFKSILEPYIDVNLRNY